MSNGDEEEKKAALLKVAALLKKSVDSNLSGTYLPHRAIDLQIAEIQKNLLNSAAQHELRLKEFTTQLDKERTVNAELQKQIGSLTSNLSLTREEAAKTGAYLQIRIGELNKLQAEIDALQTQHDAVTKYAKAAKFWEQKSRRHEVNAAIYTAAFIAIGFIFTYFCVGNHSEILQAIPKSVSGEIGIFSLAAIFLLALPLLWLLRLLSKFIVEHFQLSQDALERQTMMETFLSLVGNPEAKIQGEERILVLRSVFRSSSGSSDDVTPPTSVDLVKSIVDALKSK